MKQEPKTGRGKFNALIKKAEAINSELRRLQKKAQELADSCAEFADVDYEMYIYELRNLKETAEDLAAFDFEDSIPERARFNF